MNTNTYNLKSAAIIAGAALVPTAAVFISGMVSNAIAGTANQNINVSATVNANCKLSNPSDVAFGTFDPIDVNYSTDKDATGGFDIRCTKGVTATLTINNGQNASGVQRRMIGATTATEFLDYQLYTTAGRTTIWDTTNTVSYVATKATDTPQVIFGRIPAATSQTSADISAQNYSDIVQVTASF